MEDYKFDKIDLEIKKGTRLYFSIHGLHRDEKYYPDPEKFDPERFSKENLATRHPMTYLPFGEGPRNCIGTNFHLEPFFLKNHSENYP